MPEELAQQLSSVRVSAARTLGEVESFVNLLLPLGLAGDSFVIDDLSRLHERVRSWFPLLVHSLRGYRSLMVLRAP